MNKKTNLGNMRSSFILFLTLALLYANAATAQQTFSTKQIDPLLTLVENHTWGHSYDTLRTLDEAVISASQDQSMQEYLEQRFINILEESKNYFALQYACRQLYLIGTTESVPAIAPWLRDSEMSHMARYALANIRSESALQALREALDRTDGKVKAGIIQSLAERDDPASLGDFIRLAGDPDKIVSLAAIRALGMQGDETHIPALRKTASKSDRHYTESVNAILVITEKMLSEGKTKKAAATYEELYEDGQNLNTRMAGLKGLITTGSMQTEKLLIRALGAQEQELRGFAGRMIADPNNRLNTRKLAGALKKLPIAGKITLIETLGTRNAREVKATVMKYGNDTDPEVQAAVVRALGFLGSEEDVYFLARKATIDKKLIRETATVSLSQLQGSAVVPEILDLLPEANAPVQAVLIQGLTNRPTSEFKEEVTNYLKSPDPEVRKAVLSYLQQHGNEEDLQDLIDFIAGSDDRVENALASRTMTAICTERNKACEQPVLHNLKNIAPDLKPVLIEKLNLVNTPAALQTTVQYTSHPDREIQKTAVRTLSAWQDTSALDKLKEIMENDPDKSQRILAFRGYFRLFRQLDMNDQDKMREYRRMIQMAERKQEKLLILSAFQDIQSIDAMKRVEKYLYDPEMSHETCLTILKITDFLDPKYKPDIAIAMMQIQKVSDDENILEDVQRRFEKFNIRPSDYYDPPGIKKTAAEKRIVFISGPMDHAWYDAHEYPKDLLFLKNCMEESPDLENIRIDFYLTTDRLELDKIQGADAIVVHSSADRAQGEVHALFPNNRENMVYTAEEKAYYEKLDAMVGKAMGVATLHYAVWTDFEQSREYMTRWVGGYYDNAVSKVRMDSVPVKIEAPRHPINNGIDPWYLREEYYINQLYSKEITPLLSARLPLNRGDEPEFHTVGWSIRRKDGGRGFGYTGCHTHSHLYDEDYRQFVINAIAWTAGIDIPKNGIRTGIPEGWEQ